MDYLKFGVAFVIAFLLLFGLFALIAFIPHVLFGLLVFGGVFVLSMLIYEILDSF